MCKSCIYIHNFFFTNHTLNHKLHPSQAFVLPFILESTVIYLSMLLWRYVMRTPQRILMARSRRWEISRDFPRTGPCLYERIRKGNEIRWSGMWNTRGVNLSAARLAEFSSRFKSHPMRWCIARSRTLHSRNNSESLEAWEPENTHSRCHLRDARKLHVSQIIEYRVFSRRDIRLFDLPGR